MSSAETSVPEKEVETRILRFPTVYRIEHWVFAISFIILGITGLAQKFFMSPISIAIISALGGIQTVRIIHRVAATTMMVSVVWHIGIMFYRLYVRRFRLSMLPNLDDARNMLGWFLYNLGARKTRPQEGRYTYGEKVEYWAVVWGTVIMVITGFMLWNPIATTNFLDGQWIPAAKAAHGGEAVLAVLAIFVWHFYHVLVRTLNKSMFNGHLTETQMEHEHPIELADIKAGTHEVQVDPDKAARRFRIFVPTVSIVSGLMLIGIVWFVTFEQTALTTIVPTQSVPVFAPLTPTPLPTLAPTPTPQPTPDAPVSAVDWNTVVEPMLTAKCGACHGASALGGLDLSTYEGALAGGVSGPAVVPGEPDTSYLLIVQQAGGHPGQLSDSEIQTILAWIEAGAPESLAGAETPEEPGEEGESVAYSNTIGPLFENQCGACHGTTALGGLNLITYGDAMAGGENGPVIIPGDPDDSSLVQIQQAGGHPGQFNESDLQQVIDWIAAGAPENPTTSEPTPPPSGGPLNYERDALPVFTERCGACHGTSASGGLNLLIYASAMAGGNRGLSILPGDAEGSLLVRIQLAGNHPGQMTEEELEMIIDWINEGAIER
jgi:cytochrome b subunit of formate dehydrogenase/mono/diheme cytochrome c family protein